MLQKQITFKSQWLIIINVYLLLKHVQYRRTEELCSSQSLRDPDWKGDHHPEHRHHPTGKRVLESFRPASKCSGPANDSHITSTHNLSELVTWPQPTIMVRKYNPTPSVQKMETWEYLWNKILTTPIYILLTTTSLKSQRCFFSTLCDFSFINGN